MGLLPLLQSDPLAFGLVVVILLLSLSLHEWSHAITALWMGDSTAKEQGRVTLNPFKHLDLIGSAMILLVGFGWARPVPIYPPNFRYYRLGLFLVSIAGIVANLLIATALALVLRWMLASGYLENPSGFVLVLAQAAAIAASINLTLAVFNARSTSGWLQDCAELPAPALASLYLAPRSEPHLCNSGHTAVAYCPPSTIKQLFGLGADTLF